MEASRSLFLIESIPDLYKVCKIRKIFYDYEFCYGYFLLFEEVKMEL